MSSKIRDGDTKGACPRSKAALSSSRDRKKSANQARHRLLSIQYDVVHYLTPLWESLEKRPILVANERCGTWYAFPFDPHSFCRFKSTDGHVHLFSLKRLNLPLLKTLALSGNGVWILDASNKKEMPDSFSRTIPIWSCVLNRVAEVFRRDSGAPSLFSDSDLDLFLPNWIVPEPERSSMESVIETRVQELYHSQAIVDIPGFLQGMTKPLRPFWITSLQSELPTKDHIQSCRPIVCCNASNVRLDGTSNSRLAWMEDEQFWYTPGAADDHESWAKHLTPQLFWATHSQPFSSFMTEQETDEWIDQLVSMAKRQSESESFEEENHEQYFDWIGDLNLAIGSRKAGRPPDCWKHFDAVLNVTNTEYDMSTTDDMFYLQMPVEEGKRDKQQLERWMAVGILFCANHAREKRRILIHCAQGRDRSVAVAMAVAQLFCHSRYPLQWNWPVLNGSISEVLSLSSSDEGEETTCAQNGLPQEIAPAFLDGLGREKLLDIVRGHLETPEGESLASKESLRVVLHLIRQDREKAEPTRSTMQKINRFFMSGSCK